MAAFVASCVMLHNLWKVHSHFLFLLTNLCVTAVKLSFRSNFWQWCLFYDIYLLYTYMCCRKQTVLQHCNLFPFISIKQNMFLPWLLAVELTFLSSASVEWTVTKHIPVERCVHVCLFASSTWSRHCITMSKIAVWSAAWGNMTLVTPVHRPHRLRTTSVPTCCLMWETVTTTCSVTWWQVSATVS